MPESRVLPSLYVHVPFCIQRCAYCDYFSTVLEPGSYPEKFLTSLRQELEATIIQNDISHFDTIYIGGGSPSALPIELLDELCIILANFSTVQTEVSLEINPLDINADLLSLLSSSFINRLSIGIQSLDDKVRVACGRRGSAGQVLDSVDKLLGCTKIPWSVDVMYGLPHQTAKSVSDTISRVLELQPGHISFYELILEPASRLAVAINSRIQQLPSQDDTDASWTETLHTLQGSGFQRYEVSNFTQVGQNCRHNQHYWDLDTWYGLGPSAVGNKPIVDGKYLRHYNDPDLDNYCRNPTKAGIDETIEGNDAIFEYIMLALRTRHGLDMDRLAQQIPGIPRRKLIAAMADFPQFLQISGACISPTELGMDFLNVPLQAILTSLHEGGH